MFAYIKFLHTTFLCLFRDSNPLLQHFCFSRVSPPEIEIADRPQTEPPRRGDMGNARLREQLNVWKRLEMGVSGRRGHISRLERAKKPHPSQPNICTLALAVTPPRTGRGGNLASSLGTIYCLFLYNFTCKAPTRNIL